MDQLSIVLNGIDLRDPSGTFVCIITQASSLYLLHTEKASDAVNGDRGKHHLRRPEADMTDR